MSGRALTMGLPSFSDYQPALVVEAVPAALAQRFLVVAPPPGFREAYTAPGQFVKMRIDGLEGIFAMYSAPHEEVVRFLLRTPSAAGGEAADALAIAEPGTSIEMTLPAGEGFALESARGRTIRFVATGTGVAPVRAAIEHLLRRRDRYGALSLDHGLRSPQHLAIGDELERWRDAGVEVGLHYSQVDEAGGVRGATVQDALRDRVRAIEDEVVVAVGQDEMLDAVRRLVERIGGSADQVLVNV